METAFHFEVYRNIIPHLLNIGVQCDVVIHDRLPPTFVQEMVSFLQTVDLKGLKGCLLSKVKDNPQYYDCLVSPYFIPDIQTIARTHVRTIYGLAKETWNHAPWNTFYDAILCYSHYTAATLNLGERAKVVGNPRFDEWFNRTWQEELPESVANPHKKPVLLYAPTYGELGSIPHWGEKLSRLGKEYHLITKLHHGTTCNDREKKSLAVAKRFLKHRVTRHDITFTLLNNADYVITDNSGFIFDAILARKRVILLEWEGLSEILDGEKSYSTTLSPDQWIKTILPVAKDMAQLREYLDPEYPWEKIEQQLAPIRTEYCDAWQDGLAGIRSATEILATL